MSIKYICLLVVFQDTLIAHYISNARFDHKLFTKKFSYLFSNMSSILGLVLVLHSLQRNSFGPQPGIAILSGKKVFNITYGLMHNLKRKKRSFPRESNPGRQSGRRPT